MFRLSIIDRDTQTIFYKRVEDSSNQAIQAFVKKHIKKFGQNETDIQFIKLVENKKEPRRVSSLVV